MTPSERAGLDDIVRLVTKLVPESKQADRVTMAIRWIRYQQELDANRRVARGKYKTGAR